MKNNILTKYLLPSLLTAGVLFYSCTKEDEYEATVPSFQEVEVNNFAPKTGLPSTQVTITGKNFGDFKEPTFIYFNGIEVDQNSYISYGDSSIVFPVPVDATTGAIEVRYLTQSVLMEEEFVVIPGAKVSGLEPSIGVAGDIIAVQGENFKESGYDVSVVFESNEGGIAGTIKSISETEILVEVPKGGISGNITLMHGPQVIEGPLFTYPFTGLESDFSVDESGWVAAKGSIGTSDNVLNVSLVDGQSSIQLESGVNFDVATYPIIAMKATRMADYDLTFETDFGTFEQLNGVYNSTNYTGVLYGDIYYWDLTSGVFKNEAGESHTMSTTEDNITELVQFNLNTMLNSGLKIEYIRSFENLPKLEEYAEQSLPDGKYVWEFDRNESEKVNCDWTDHRSSNATHQADGKFVVTFGEGRLDMCQNWKNGKNSTAGQNVPGDADWVDNWVYNPEFPIYAARMGNRPAGSWFTRAFRSERGFGGNDHILNSIQISESRTDNTGTFISDDVFYWDMSVDLTNTEMMTDNLTGRQGTNIYDMNKFNGSEMDASVIGQQFELEWFITFRSVAELEEYLANGN
ncbi:IPT/TIG domain-containing protein [Flammeovirga aprica]|uniref:DUF4979 domain-containing protein n=1 Tax=Flammeovirga aprica JL-4 TaxID=694437 RepID=A0A7X9X9E1_9BACT|nr:DUF4979 domain-containing protein [Flammeovirga aprica]NME68786.1 DUF4979 domain-containing protein [Flammeovirga aprica JL-4]